MTIQELSQLTYIKKGIEIQQKRLEDLEYIAKKKHKARAKMLNITDEDKNLEILKKISKCNIILEQQIAMYAKEYAMLSKYIFTIKDSILRQIMTLRFIHGLTWVQVAKELGGGNSADGVRMTVKRFLAKQKL